MEKTSKKKWVRYTFHMVSGKKLRSIWIVYDDNSSFCRMLKLGEPEVCNFVVGTLILNANHVEAIEVDFKEE